jgi:hypothetical protein
LSVSRLDGRLRASTFIVEVRPMWADFKAFIAKGNVMDLAVAVIRSAKRPWLCNCG